jgi:hypothetical protein
VRTLVPYLALVLSTGALTLQMRDRFSSYLRLKLTLDRDGDTVVATTCVDNPSSWPRRMTKIFLLVGPEEEHPVDTFNTLLGEAGDDRTACCAIDFEFFDLPKRFMDVDRQRLLVPIDYYIEENSEVGDEALSCQTSIRERDLTAGLSYGIRFYVFGHRWRRARIHRKVHAVLALPGEPPKVTGLSSRHACRGYKGCGATLSAPFSR